MVGPIEILPPLSRVHATAAARALPIEPAGRTDRTGARPAPAAAVVDVEAELWSSDRAGAGDEHAGRRRARPAQPLPVRRALYGTPPVGAAKSARLRETGTLAYRSADGLAADVAHRGTFFDLKV